MKVLAPALASLATFTLCNANVVAIPRHSSAETYAVDALAAPLAAIKRGLPNSPSGGYSPASVPCPANRPTIRNADSLSANETAWLELRRNATVDPMISWLSRMNISGFDASTYINGIRNNATALPNIGLAVSGGGYRALMNGAGFLAAADNRTSNATNTGQIGGLLQASTYVAGLSGGGWLVGSIYTNNFSSVEDLRDGSKGSDVWHFSNNILEGPDGDGIQLLSTADYWTTLANEVSSKEDAGFNTSITDYWGRALSFQLVNATDGGPAYTFSSIALQENFASGSIPMPFLVSDSRAPYTTIVSLNSTVFEFSPFELGSWDPTTYAFAPLQYIGSNFSAGVVPSDEECIEGFDQAGFVMGTSSTLFNEVLIELNASSVPTVVQNVLNSILSDIGFDNNDIAQYQPNPFYHFNNATNRNANSTELTLVDGGEDGQNIPLYPLIQPIRQVDVIFAVDSSADTDNHWPNGTSLVATYQRSLNATVENGTAFPSIPDQNTFVNLGLNNHPTFFGCNTSNLTGPAPLIVYIPNAPYITQSNVSTYDLEYIDTQRNLIIQNGYEVATLANATLDSQWPTCMACAVLSRSFEKTGTTVPTACQQCFDRYCWNGTVDSSTPGSYEPTFKVGEISGAGNVRVGTLVSVAAVIVAMLLV
ncbi:lysophospholipase-like protein [Mollisia scopiformis]|uniref:Lysophospholipase n=1 Tax=Mollisia scopiformis TaxID=149040 RepID=A0A132BB49_MOLSC|nr:lysophospholipase-like protein [Mollisia scopiformis]KUJ09635.1 lysophospholipase-like protein [Mollisia scopiformis]